MDILFIDYLLILYRSIYPPIDATISYLFLWLLFIVRSDMKADLITIFWFLLFLILYHSLADCVCVCVYQNARVCLMCARVHALSIHGYWHTLTGFVHCFMD